MDVFEIGPWRVEADPESTREAYAATAAILCDCAQCTNFWAARREVYPAAFLDLLGRLGVDSHAEDEVTEYGAAHGESWWKDYERERGRWQEWTWMYMGWFWALGRISGPPSKAIRHDEDTLDVVATPSFSYALSSSREGTQPLRGSPFDRDDRFGIQFKADVPWVLETPPWKLPPGVKDTGPLIDL